MQFNNKDRILFIGDSITDSGRKEDNEMIGWGYVRLIRDYLHITNPNKSLHVLNKGVSGNRISDLEARWKVDVIDLNPDYLSVSIGVNDVWRQLDHPEMEQVFPDQYKEIYIRILEEVKENTNATIILMEPTIIEEDLLAKGNQLLKAYVQVVHEVAEEFEAIVVPTHQAFVTYLEAQNEQPLTTDGVHMNSLGDMLMMKEWIEAVLG
ncbi:SGNH/GDSL hydrolase family protein [Halalkalibacter sp. APA_J-10(15)]|uniref:SGNH/GDSL hydrolase family protein n=1 Tax=Halalkalibacter sp. APA_J-10(15) TaxID=2933805 RepID=UPI001FF54F62|nr:SGNH/GDSL hydrolase family protein [Halalkalibacter sp. APA_J-10(15)]MCK0471860.1 SGNH/GDSL hydrolase family protein [Halalkalibacter sp. APA_J-10(15)]